MSKKPKHSVHVSKGRRRKHITIETPCTASELEHLLGMISHEGHWHDAQISADQGVITIGYEDDMKRIRAGTENEK